MCCVLSAATYDLPSGWYNSVKRPWYQLARANPDLLVLTTPYLVSIRLRCYICAYVCSSVRGACAWFLCKCGWEWVMFYFVLFWWSADISP